MKIRSITYFLDPGWPLDGEKIGEAGGFLDRARSAFEAAGYEVQTTRLATPPFPVLLGGAVAQLPRLAENLTELLGPSGIAYASLGPALIGSPQSYSIIPEAIAASRDVFFGGVMASAAHGISLEAVRACARVVQQTAALTADGFANLRFAALANVGPGAPFFPAAYHAGGAPAFAIATEAADLAVEAFSNASAFGEARRGLISRIEQHAQAIARLAAGLAGARFGGVDFSLAPFPDDSQSLGNAVERMGVPRVGRHGSLAAAALLTEAVEQADFPRCGFSGFMQPLLEDSVLARRAAEGTLTVKDLLLYSAVCGTGLDTVPLPGDTTADQIVPLLLDVCALSLRLDKPLTARLMPVPGRKAGDPTEFDFGFFANSRVLRLDSEPLTGGLGGDESIPLSPMHRWNP
jgi:hypothetical protein